MNNIEDAINLIKGKYKRGEIVMFGSQKCIFCGIGENITASLFFENGNVWNKPFDKVEKYTGDLKNDTFAKNIKLKFYHVKNWRKNFRSFF